MNKSKKQLGTIRKFYGILQELNDTISEVHLIVFKDKHYYKPAMNAVRKDMEKVVHFWKKHRSELQIFENDYDAIRVNWNIFVKEVRIYGEDPGKRGMQEIFDLYLKDVRDSVVDLKYMVNEHLL